MSDTDLSSGKRFGLETGTKHMSMPSFTSSDSTYPAGALHALQLAMGYLEGKNDGSTVNLSRLLEDMKHRARFEAPYRSDEPRSPIRQDGFKYRQPVWSLIYQVSSRHNPTLVTSEEKCADWLQGLLVKSAQCCFLMKELAALKSRLKEKNIEVTVDSSGPPAALWIHVDPVEAGKDARHLLKVILNELIYTMERLQK